MNGEPVYVSLDVELTGQRIHNAIKDSGYSVRQIQEMMKLEDPHSVYRWIHGRSIPSTDNLYKLSRILNVSMESLLCAIGTADKVDKME